MKGFKKLAVILWKVWIFSIAIFLILTVGIFWTLPLSYSQRTVPLAYKGIRFWAACVFYGAGFKLEFDENQKRNSQKPSVIISNHYSPFDILVLILLHKNQPLVFVGKEELVNIPIFGQIYRQICITVDRSNMKNRGKVFNLASEKLQQGSSIVIFPEGGIPDDRTIILQRFKEGAFRIAISNKVPLIVYSIKGLKEMFPESWTEGYPGKVKVKLLDVIPTENLSLTDKENLKSTCYEKLFYDLKSN